MEEPGDEVGVFFGGAHEARPGPRQQAKRATNAKHPEDRLAEADGHTHQGHRADGEEDRLAAVLGQRPQGGGDDEDEGEGQRAELARQRHPEEEGGDGEALVRPPPLAWGEGGLAEEVEAAHDERAQHQVADEEVALLDVEDGEPDHRGGEQALPASEEPPSDEVDEDDGERVEERGDDTARLRELDQRGILEEGRGEIAGGLEEVERERAVGEPAGVPHAFNGKERAEVPEGEGHLADAQEDGPLVGVVEAAIVPVQAPQAEEERQADEEGEKDEIEPRGAGRHGPPQGVRLRALSLFGGLPRRTGSGR